MSNRFSILSMSMSLLFIASLYGGPSFASEKDSKEFSNFKKTHNTYRLYRADDFLHRKKSVAYLTIRNGSASLIDLKKTTLKLAEERFGKHRAYENNHS